MQQASALRRTMGKCTAVALALVVSLPAMAQTEQETLVAEARTTLNNFIRDPQMTWVQENLGKARGVLIAPQIVKAGFIFGGSGGRAVLATRGNSGWSGPAFYTMATASVGFQAGLEVSEAVILVMTEKGVNSLLAPSVKLGGDASIAAGPVGAGAKSTVTADLITFTRSKGIFGGLNLDGTVVTPSNEWNEIFYGKKGVLPPDILVRATVKTPKADGLLADIQKVAGK